MPIRTKETPGTGSVASPASLLGAGTERPLPGYGASLLHQQIVGIPFPQELPRAPRKGDAKTGPQPSPFQSLGGPLQRGPSALTGGQKEAGRQLPPIQGVFLALLLIPKMVQGVSQPLPNPLRCHVNSMRPRACVPPSKPGKWTEPTAGRPTRKVSLTYFGSGWSPSARGKDGGEGRTPGSLGACDGGRNGRRAGRASGGCGRAGHREEGPSAALAWARPAMGVSSQHRLQSREAQPTALSTGSGPGTLRFGHLSVRPSVHSQLSAVCYSGCQVCAKPWKSRKKIQPPRNSDSRISAPLSPGTWGFGMAQPASQLTRSRDPLSERFCPLGSPPCFPSGPAMES